MRQRQRWSLFVCCFRSALLRGSAVTPIQATTDTGEPRSVTVFVIADGVPPILNSPSDFTYEEGATGNTINWTYSSSDPNGTTVERNGTTIASGFWASNDTYPFNVDGLTPGVYNHTIIVTNTYGNKSVDTVFVTVIAGTIPTWNQPLANQTVEYGSTFRYNVSAWDFSGISSYWINDTGNFNIDTNGIITNKTALSVGMYGLRVNVTDKATHTLSGTFNVTVQDTTAPNWAPTPVDQTVDYGSPFIYDIDATDPSGISTWWVSDAVNFQIDASGVITNNTFLAVGVYALRVNVTDNHGNHASATFSVTVQDITPPSWAPTPIDQTVEFGNPFIYDIDATDLSGISTWWVSDTVNFQIDASGVITNKTSLAVGIYALRVNVTDNHGNHASATFSVTVQDTTPPKWDQDPVDWIVDYSKPFRYDLNASDLSGISGWWINDTVHFQIDANGVITNITSLTIRTYTVRVNVTDNHGQVRSATFHIIARDTSKPVWDQVPIDQSIEYRNTFRYDLNATHPSGISGWAINDTTNFQIDSNGVITNKTLLAVGLYGLNVTVTNNLGNSLSAMFTITVQASAPPIWAPAPTDQIVELGNSFSYQLIATDISGIGSWWVNDTTNFAISSAGLITNKTFLAFGVHWLRVNVTDRLGNIQTATFKVTVQDTASPTWLQSPVDHVIEEGSAFRYDLNATDLSGISRYWVNDTTHFTVSGIGVVTNATDLSAGIYPLRVYVNDTHGNSMFDIFKVTVLASAPPTWDQPLANQTVEYGSTFRYNVSASDFSGISSYWINDTVNFQIDTNGIITNKTALSVGMYGLRVNVTDKATHTLSGTFNVTIQDTTFPVWAPAPADQTVELGDIFRYDLNATDFSGITWSINGTYFAIDAKGVVRNATTLPVGVYHIYVNATDPYNHVLSESFKVTVQDTTLPVWVHRPSDLQYVVNATGNTLSWTVYDLAPGTIQILRNGTQVSTPTWATRSQVIPISVDGLIVGTYNYTIVIKRCFRKHHFQQCDGSGNSAYNLDVANRGYYQHNSQFPHERIRGCCDYRRGRASCRFQGPEGTENVRTP